MSWRLDQTNGDDPRFDPAEFILEHYVDGDLLDMTEPTHRNPEKESHLHVWGEFKPEALATYIYADVPQARMSRRISWCNCL